VTPDRAFRIRAVFFIHALASGGLYPRIPQIQAMLEVNEATLGLLFLGFPVGAILTFLFGSRLIEVFGTQRIMALCIPALPVATALLGAIPQPGLFFAYFVLYGVVYSLPNTAMNIEADRIEAASAARVMNSCHGLWSVGYLIATLFGTLAEAVQLSPLMHMGLLALPLVPFALWVTAGLDPAPARPHAAQVTRRLALPTAAILLLVLFTLGPSLLEGALRNWSVIYMRDSFGAPSWVDTLTLPVFLAAHAVGRLNADRVVTRFGVVPVARTLAALALTGTLLVVLAPNLWVALAGFLLIGVGVCTAYPMTTSAAAQLGDRPATLNVASLTLATSVILLAAPAGLGWVAEHWGITSVFTVLLPAIGLSVWLARWLVPRAPGHGQ
jgi:MFS family permease